MPSLLVESLLPSCIPVPGSCSLQPGPQAAGSPGGEAPSSRVLHTHGHAIEWKLPVDFELIRDRQPPAGVQQDVVELEEQGQARLRCTGCTGSAGNQRVQKPHRARQLDNSATLAAPLASRVSSRLPRAPQAAEAGPGPWGRGEDKRLPLLTRKNMRCWSPFPESLLRLPKRMNSCGENRP